MSDHEDPVNKARRYFEAKNLCGQSTTVLQSIPFSWNSAEHPPRPLNENARVELLHACKLLDTLSEVAFDRITHVTAKVFEVPMALITSVILLKALLYCLFHSSSNLLRSDYSRKTWAFKEFHEAFTKL